MNGQDQFAANALVTSLLSDDSRNYDEAEVASLIGSLDVETQEPFFYGREQETRRRGSVVGFLAGVGNARVEDDKPKAEPRTQGTVVGKYRITRYPHCLQIQSRHMSPANENSMVLYRIGYHAPYGRIETSGLFKFVPKLRALPFTDFMWVSWRGEVLKRPCAGIVYDCR
ncbi:MAG: hypothetical protein AB7G06_05375 [Bdellovibrionales bacterium]